MVEFKKYKNSEIEKLLEEIYRLKKENEALREKLAKLIEDHNEQMPKM
tara:strand:- start:1317 stop:1460 length:144 start_codon:yes stop_codon:yes gene_type:complete